MSASVFPQARINYFLSCAVRGLSSATELMSTQIIDEHCIIRRVFIVILLPYNV
jgi:hypothetical protein